MPLEDVLAGILPLIPLKYLIGIRNIFILDAAYQKGDVNSAKYVKIEGTNRADFEIYQKGFDNTSEEIRNSRMCLTYLLTHYLGYLIFIYGVTRNTFKCNPGQNEEHKTATKWAHKLARWVTFRKLFPGGKGEWDSIQATLRQKEKRMNQATMPNHE